MTPDEIINSAFNNGGGVQGEGLFLLEGNPERNMFRVLPADKAFTDNLNCFIWAVNTGFQYMGVFTTELEAHKAITLIRERLRDEEGNRI